MLTARKSPNLSLLLFVLFALLLAWWLARAMVVNAIAERNQALLHKAENHQPWFSWVLDSPHELVGPSAELWQKAAGDGLENITSQPVISVPFQGQTLDARTFARLAVEYEASRPWRMRVHFSTAENHDEYFSDEIQIPASQQRQMIIPLDQLNWHTIPQKPPRSRPAEQLENDARWGGDRGQVSSLLLYFLPVHPEPENPSASRARTLRIYALSFPWPAPSANQPGNARAFSPTGQEKTAASIDIHTRVIPCRRKTAWPEQNALLPASRSVIRLELDSPCLFPEHTIWLDNQTRLTPQTVFLPEKPWPVTSATGHLLAFGLFALVAFGIRFFCLKNKGVTTGTRQRFTRWPGFLLVLLTLNYGMASGLEAAINWLPSGAKQLLAFLGVVPIVIWLWRNDAKRLRKNPADRVIFGVVIVLSVLASLILQYKANAAFNTLAFAKYLIWAIIQQLIIGPFVATRLHRQCGLSSMESALLAGLVFSLLHFPNPALMLITAFAGTLWAWLWLRYRLLLPLAISHALLALSLFAWADSWWLTSGRVGMDFLGL